MIEHISWSPGALRLLDQRLLPERIEFVECLTPAGTASAIRDMAVRGAPAIGVTAAYGVALAAFRRQSDDASVLLSAVEPAGTILKAARPTAVNLAWAVERMVAKARQMEKNGMGGDEFCFALSAEAVAIHREDVAACRAIGHHGGSLLPKRARVLTHCNAGALATGGYGTALGVVRAAFEAGGVTMVYAGETRPYMQGARLTAWELSQDNIPVTVLCDNVAGSLMAKRNVDIVIVGADRVAANGDTANKIGTYGLAVLARHHGIPFVVAAPSSTFDLTISSGASIPIENRPGEEAAIIAGRRVVPENVPVLYPAFDVTPAPLISAIVTERGVISPVAGENITKVLGLASR